METKVQTPFVVDISHVPCPACGRSDRWEAMSAHEPESNNPHILVLCDCGQGELKVVVE